MRWVGLVMTDVTGAASMKLSSGRTKLPPSLAVVAFAGVQYFPVELEDFPLIKLRA